jgi:hypothetical protein
MKYYVWLDAEERPLSKAWRYDDETERMTAESTRDSTMELKCPSSSVRLDAHSRDRSR